MAEFIYQEPFPIQEDKTEYRLLTKDYVKVVECDGRKILKVDPKGTASSLAISNFIISISLIIASKV